MTWRGRLAVYLACISLLWQLFRAFVLHRPLGWLGWVAVVAAVIVLLMAERYTEDDDEVTS